MFFFPALMTAQNKANVRECLKPPDNLNFGVAFMMIMMMMTTYDDDE